MSEFLKAHVLPQEVDFFKKHLQGVSWSAEEFTIFSYACSQVKDRQRQKQRSRLNTLVGSLCCPGFLTRVQSVESVFNRALRDYVSQAFAAFGHLQNLQAS